MGDIRELAFYGMHLGSSGSYAELSRPPSSNFNGLIRTRGPEVPYEGRPLKIPQKRDAVDIAG
jgi:hypothetical protein